MSSCPTECCCAWTETRTGPGFGVLTDGSAAAVCRDAEDYYERPVDRQAVAALLAGAPLNPRTVTALNPAADFKAMAGRARSRGYPVADT